MRATTQARGAPVPSLLDSPGGRTFLWLWSGQTVSLLGSGLTAFAVGVWLYQETGAVTPFALTALFGFLPAVLIGPFAGVVVDRVDRKWAMLGSDLVQGIVTLALLGLLVAGRLELPMIYGLLAVGSAAGAFQVPAQMASISLLVPREGLGRANGLLSISDGAGNLIAPILAGALVPLIGLPGVLLVDAGTFLVGAGILLFLRIPRPPVTAAGRLARGSMLREARFGWTYIRERPGLFGLLLVFAGINLLLPMAGVLMVPMVLARSAGDTAALGLATSAFGLGAILGGLLMAAWGGPRPRVHGVLGGLAVGGFLAWPTIGLGGILPFWIAGNLLVGLLLPVINGSSQAIWQSKVAPDLQGRVFATRRAIAQFTSPVAFLLAGPLADRVFTPLATGSLRGVVEPLVGTGPGAGFALMFVAVGILAALVSLSGYLRPAVRNVERDLPDFDLPDTSGAAAA